jgi:plastocyanin domain-containing protein
MAPWVDGDGTDFRKNHAMTRRRRYEMKEKGIAAVRVGVLAIGAILLLGVGVALALAAKGDVTAADEPVQRVAIEVTGRGFVPAALEAAVGGPVDLVFTRTSPSGCAAEVHIPSLGVDRTALPVGEPVVIRVDPGRAGTYEVLCGMDMLRATLVVREAPAR